MIPSVRAALQVALPCSPENALMSSGGEPNASPQGDKCMESNNGLALRAVRKTVANIGRELAALKTMSVGELAEKYREVFGEPTRTRNKEYLRKRIAYRLQEQAEGGLSLRALERIEQLAPDAPVRWRQPVVRQDSPGNPVVVPITKPTRDPRLPPPGTILSRRHNGVAHQVTVLDDGFDYNGERYSSLSRVARVITGKAWNGYMFFFGRSHGTPKGTEAPAP